MKTTMLSLGGVIFISVLLLHSGSGIPVQDETIYTFGLFTQFKPYEFISESGDMMGFSVDIIRRVCELAKKKCEFIAYNDFNLCWNNQTMLSEGLSKRYWDVCPNTQSKDIMVSYGFLGTYAQELPAYLFARAGTTFTEYSPGRHRIGFAKGCRLNPYCMKTRMGINVTAPRYYDTHPLLLAGLLKDEIDVAFTIEYLTIMIGANKFRKVSELTRCGENGLGLMMRKDTIPKYQWFDKTLRKEVLPSKYYTWACNIAKMAYGLDPYCLKKEDIK